MWAEMERRPYAVADLSGELDYLTVAIANRLPCGECRRDWLAMLAAHPPDLSSPDAYFASIVGYHNAVNAKLGKPQMSVEDARLFHER